MPRTLKVVSHRNRDRGAACAILAALSIIALGLTLLSPNRATAEGVELSEEPKPLQVDEIPERPQPLEAGNPFLGTGPIAPGFTLPTGATWQPQVLVWGTIRSAFQTSTRTGRSSDRTGAWVNRVDIFGELEVSPTERMVIGFRPVDKKGNFSGCTFRRGLSPFDKGCDAAWEGEPHVGFLEANFSELFPKLDPEDRLNLDVEFSAGRQPFLFQDGILVNDFMDGFAIAKNNIPIGINTRVFGIVTINDINRVRGNTPARSVTDGDAILSMIGVETDFSKTTMNVDAVYVNSDRGDSFHGGISFIQRIRKLNTLFRALYSDAIDGDNSKVSTGGLLFSEINYVLPTGPRVSHDQVYLNTFVGIDEFSSAARDQGTGGPLGRTGSVHRRVTTGPTYGAPLGNTVDDTYGIAVGGEKFLNNGRDVVLIELGFRHDWNNEDLSAIALGVRYQRALGRRVILRAEGFTSGVHIAEGGNSARFGWGTRGELLFRF